MHKNAFRECTRNLKINARVVSADVLGQIRRYLKGWKGTSTIRRKVKKHSFFLMNFASATDVVCVNRRINGRSKMKTNTILRVAAIEDIFDILHRYHCIEGKHTEIRNLHINISREFDYIPRSVVDAFISLCPTCNLKTT